MQEAIITAVGSATAVIITAIGGVYLSIRKNNAEKQERDAAMAGEVQKIHILVNSRFTVAQRVITLLAQERAERTKKPEDRQFYEDAKRELIEIEAAGKAVEALSATDVHK